MIDLEDALARIVELAPEPPDIARVSRRARQRRSRRRTTLFAIVVVVAIGTIGAIALQPTSNEKRPILQNPSIESVRVTLLDGSQLEISGPESLGLTKLEPAFNAQLDNPSAFTQIPIGHSFTVVRDAPKESGAIVGRYPTGDGHELVVYATASGVDAVVEYERWALVVSWNHDPTIWGAFATALNARESGDGFLVIEPIGDGWRLGPTDAPDVQLGGDAYGSGATFSFFSESYRSHCPRASMTSTTTPQGWHVGVGAVGSRFWCDDSARVGVVAWNPNLVDDAIQGLRVRRLN
jgi:hypothetical protein